MFSDVFVGYCDSFLAAEYSFYVRFKDIILEIIEDDVVDMWTVLSPVGDSVEI